MPEPGPDGRSTSGSSPALRPGTIGGLRLPHRIVMGSMHLGTEAAPDAAETMAAFYAERARGGAGLIVTGGAAVSRVGAGGASYAILGEESGEALGAIPAAVHGEAAVALQLFHAGRYGFEAAFGLQPVAPSAVASRFNRETPRALDEDEILATIDDFARAAAQARAWGYDAVEVMGSEGYLVDQFLSPLTNRRDDDWGGDAERRRRFGVELVRGIRAATGDDFPIIFRFTGIDLMPAGSTTPDEVVAFAGALADAGADALNVGIGWHESTVPTVQGSVPPGIWFPWAERIKAAVGDVPVIAGNRVNRVELADALLASGTVDFVSMARPFLADPEIVAKARDGRPTNVCIACNQACIERSIGEGHVSCMVNPRAGFEREFPVGGPGEHQSNHRTGRPSVAVIGGGPAGLEAARALATLGVAVELFEAESELGGQFRYARLVPGKEDFGATIEYFAAELDRLGVTVHLGRPLGPDDHGLLRTFDGVVLATGVLPRRVDLEGADLPHVVDYGVAFTDGVAGDRIVILGAGGIGVDLAHRLTHRGAADETHAEHAGADTDAVGPIGGARHKEQQAGTAPRMRANEPGADPGGMRAFRRRWGLKDPVVDGSAGAGDDPAPRGGGTGDPPAPRPAGEAPQVTSPQVTLLRRTGRIGAGMGRTTRWVSIDALRRADVQTHTGVIYRRIAPDGVHLTLDGGAGTFLPADTVVIAAGQERNDALRPTLDALGVPHRVIGGAHDAAGLDAVRAFGDGLRAAYELAGVLRGR